MIRFADDIAVLEDTGDKLQDTLTKINKILQEKYNMKINTKKREVMLCGWEQIMAGIRISDTLLKQVNTFAYLGSKITSTEKSLTDIKSRIAQAKVAFTN